MSAFLSNDRWHIHVTYCSVFCSDWFTIVPMKSDRIRSIRISQAVSLAVMLHMFINMRYFTPFWLFQPSDCLCCKSYIYHVGISAFCLSQVCVLRRQKTSQLDITWVTEVNLYIVCEFSGTVPNSFFNQISFHGSTPGLAKFPRREPVGKITIPDVQLYEHCRKLNTGINCENIYFISPYRQHRIILA